MIRDYIVEVEQRHTANSGLFVNVKPVAVLENGEVAPLSSLDRTALLPDSTMGNINIQYAWRDERVRAVVTDLFPDRSLVVLRFGQEELADNVDRDGIRQSTGYYLRLDDLRVRQRISSLRSAGVYCALQRGTVSEEELCTSAVVRFCHDVDGLEDSGVFVELADMWAGPFDAAYNPTEDRYEITPNLRSAGHILSGLGPSDCSTAVIPLASGESLMLLIPREAAAPVRRDITTTETLLDGLREAAAAYQEDEDSTGAGLTDMVRLAAAHSSNPLFGSVVPEEIRDARLGRLEKLLGRGQEMEDLLENLGGELLARHLRSDTGLERLRAYLDSDPEFVNSLSDVQAYRRRLEELQDKLSDLREAYEELKNGSVLLSESERAEPEETERLRSRVAELEAQLAPVRNFVDMELQSAELELALQRLTWEYEHESKRKEMLDREIEDLRGQYSDLIEHAHKRMLQVEYDGFISQKVVEAASKWQDDSAERIRQERWAQISGLGGDAMDPAELIRYLVDTVKLVRPTYDAQTILNAAICLSQGFLTVFSGASGCGKTSMSNILADVLGLNRIAGAAGMEEEDLANRYVPVSVEKGWSSKRDLLGYYNPLTRTFDDSNHRLFEGMRQLDYEQARGESRFPFVVLLDEANLSQMEYYWSDFMDVCDHPGTSRINLGPNLACRVPETLRFVATVNNDDTTMPLSPRLIDRSWIITLPDVYANSLTGDEVPAEKIRIVRWEDLQRTFDPVSGDSKMSKEIEDLYADIRKRFADIGYKVSARADKAIRSYCDAASRCFDLAAPQDAMNSISALDFAVSQRLLPKISGSGDRMEEWLTSLSAVCRRSGLKRSQDILDGILARGKDRMKYYTFFY